MNTVMFRSLILFVVVTFGDTNVMTPETRQKINQCLQWINPGSHAKCFKDDSLRVKCLKDVVPANDFGKTMLEEALNYEEAKQKSCPKLTKEKRCVDREIAMCMAKVFTSRIFQKREICNQIQKARVCLVKLNNTCDSDVVIPEIMTLDTVKDECDSGYWNDGPCSPRNVTLCTTGILYNVYQHGETIFTYDCGKLDTVNTCLNDMKTNCSLKKLHDEIDRTLKAVDVKCPTVNSK